MIAVKPTLDDLCVKCKAAEEQLQMLLESMGLWESEKDEEDNED